MKLRQMNDAGKAEQMYKAGEDVFGVSAFEMAMKDAEQKGWREGEEEVGGEGLTRLMG